MIDSMMLPCNQRNLSMNSICMMKMISETYITQRRSKTHGLTLTRTWLVESTKDSMPSLIMISSLTTNKLSIGTVLSETHMTDNMMLLCNQRNLLMNSICTTRMTLEALIMPIRNRTHGQTHMRTWQEVIIKDSTLNSKEERELTHPPQMVLFQLLRIHNMKLLSNQGSLSSKNKCTLKMTWEMFITQIKSLTSGQAHLKTSDIKVKMDLDRLPQLEEMELSHLLLITSMTTLILLESPWFQNRCTLKKI